jgi:hypothetical protein
MQFQAGTSLNIYLKGPCKLFKFWEVRVSYGIPGPCSTSLPLLFTSLPRRLVSLPRLLTSLPRWLPDTLPTSLPLLLTSLPRRLVSLPLLLNSLPRWPPDKLPTSLPLRLAMLGRRLPGDTTILGVGVGGRTWTLGSILLRGSGLPGRTKHRSGGSELLMQPSASEESERGYWLSDRTTRFTNNILYKTRRFWREVVQRVTLNRSPKNYQMSTQRNMLLRKTERMKYYLL